MYTFEKIHERTRATEYNKHDNLLHVFTLQQCGYQAIAWKLCSEFLSETLSSIWEIYYSTSMKICYILVHKGL